MTQTQNDQTFVMVRSGNSLQIDAKANLVASTVQGQREVLLQALEPAPDKVVLNLGSTDQLDSLGITLILGLFKSCSKGSIPFEVQGVPPNMMRVFQLFSLQKLFPVTGR
jgi:anti-anti-sigma factor